MADVTAHQQQLFFEWLDGIVLSRHRPTDWICEFETVMPARTPALRLSSVHTILSEV